MAALLTNLAFLFLGLCLSRDVPPQSPTTLMGTGSTDKFRVKNPRTTVLVKEMLTGLMIDQTIPMEQTNLVGANSSMWNFKVVSADVTDATMMGTGGDTGIVIGAFDLILEADFSLQSQVYIHSKGKMRCRVTGDGMAISIPNDKGARLPRKGRGIGWRLARTANGDGLFKEGSCLFASGMKMKIISSKLDDANLLINPTSVKVVANTKVLGTVLTQSVIWSVQSGLCKTMLGASDASFTKEKKRVRKGKRNTFSVATPSSSVFVNELLTGMTFDETIGLGCFTMFSTKTDRFTVRNPKTSVFIKELLVGLTTDQTIPMERNRIVGANSFMKNFKVLSVSTKSTEQSNLIGTPSNVHMGIENLDLELRADFSLNSAGLVSVHSEGRIRCRVTGKGLVVTIPNGPEGEASCEFSDDVTMQIIWINVDKPNFLINDRTMKTVGNSWWSRLVTRSLIRSFESGLCKTMLGGI